ncbi:MAG: 2-oxoacid:acceptor oxidoreductase subunit alpha, partial [candidate division WOR-3 bacterium]
MRELLSGNEACVRGALAAGVTFFAGYPITPSTEIAEEMARVLPQRGGVFIQMEDEIASICAMLGASAAGRKAMTATSGPGFSLMQEGIGYACMAELPVLIVNVMRGGPATGLPTRPAQADVMQARWGTHGDHPGVAIVPKNVQECFEMMILAVNVSERLRMPVSVRMDEIVGHMREVVELPDRESEESGPRPDLWLRPKLTTPVDEYLHYADWTNCDSALASFGDGYRIHLTGLTHRPDGFPTNDPKVIAWKMERLQQKIALNRHWLYDVVATDVQGADTVICSYGSIARSAQEARFAFMQQHPDRRVGHFRLRMIWPFPQAKLVEELRGVRKLVVPEMNQGQMRHEFERAI